MRFALKSFAVMSLLLLATTLFAADPAAARAKLLEMQIDYTEPMFLASVNAGRADLVRLFVEAGMNPNLRDPNSGFTVLMLAANVGKAEAAEALIEGGADPNARDASGKTPLLYASVTPQTEVIKTLLKFRADPNAVDQQESVTPLHVIIRGAQPGSVDAVSVLVANGANLELADSKGVTPLLLAVRSCDTAPIVRLLVQAGSNVNARDNFGSSALALAEAFGCKDSTEVLRAAGGKK